MTLAERPASDWADPAQVFEDHLLPRPDWQHRALCRGKMTDGQSLWFSPRPSERAEARRICGRCPVQAECATFHAAHADDEGSWGDKAEQAGAA